MKAFYVDRFAQNGCDNIDTSLRYTGDEADFLKNIGFRIQFFRKKSGLSQDENGTY